MIFGAHFLIYSRDADADRAFFRDVLGLHSVDAGHGWFIFTLPPSELAIHPAEDQSSEVAAGHQLLGAVLYLMCNDLNATISSLNSKGVQCSERVEARWGSVTTFPLPSGGRIGLYEPKHPLAAQLD